MHCSILPDKNIKQVIFSLIRCLVDQNLSNRGQEFPFSHPIRVGRSHWSSQPSDVIRRLRGVPVRRLDRGLPHCQGGEVCQVAEGVQVQVSRGARAGKNSYILAKVVATQENLNSAEVIEVS